MKINELRVGNYLRMIISDGLFPAEERSINPSEFLALYENPNWGEPIFLTEEWLIKFGFKKRGIRFYLKSFEILSSKTCGFEFTGFRNIPVYLETVHQLQNVYYAIMNEELTINNI